MVKTTVDMSIRRPFLSTSCPSQLRVDLKVMPSTSPPRQAFLGHEVQGHEGLHLLG